MNLISEYVLKVGVYVIFAMLLEGLIPGGAAQKYVKLVLSLLFVFVLVQPLLAWAQSDMSLETLTLGEAEAQPDTSYEEQARAMVQEGCEKALLEQGLPPELREKYRLMEVKVGEQVEVTLARSEGSGGMEAGELNLGRIGAGEAERKALQKSLCAYWGLETEGLEMRIR